MKPGDLRLIVFWRSRLKCGYKCLAIHGKLQLMITRFSNLLKFQVERFIVRGTFYRLLFIAVVIVLISFTGGVLGLWISTDFADTWDATWWAFLRLTDPGYLGDDEGGAKRTVSTVLTILGYVLFMGALIAIMTQWLHETIARLQSGLTPIVQKNHFLILGWSDRTPVIVEQLLLSEGRIQRFLQVLGAKKLRIVILADEDIPSLVQTLKDHLGPLYQSNQIIFRTGTPLKLEHLRRVDFLRAAAILLPTSDSRGGGDASSDGRTIKTLLSAAHTPSDTDAGMDGKPLMVVELLDARSTAIAEHAYGGPIEVLAGDLMVSRIITQIVRQRGLSHVFSQLLSQNEGNHIYTRECRALAGKSFREAFHAFPKAILLGVTRNTGGNPTPIMNPSHDFIIAPQDALILAARDFKDTIALAQFKSAPPIPASSKTAPAQAPKPRHRVLILGWNQMAPALIREFDGYESEPFDLDLMSLTPAAHRQTLIERQESVPKRVQMRLIEGDYLSKPDLVRLEPDRYDSIVILASDRMDSDAESEARALLGYLILQELLAGKERRPKILVELMTSENTWMFESRGDEIIITPLLLSHLLTQVALRRELNGVFDQLFGPDGTEFFFRPAGDYALPTDHVTFSDVHAAAMAQGETALGLRLRNRDHPSPQSQIVINPDRDASWNLSDLEAVVVLRN